MKRPPRTAAEQDALTPWRRVYGYLKRAGVASAIKRGYRRYERRVAKDQIRRGEES